MSYVVIARRWRPQQFKEIIGQEHVSQTLSNSIANNRIAHSYIFTGPRGVGKTTSARILAKALNCEKGPTPTPCNECASCTGVTKGSSLDVLEIDGASNRGIDEIRNLRENIRFTPTQGKYRIYIIDEVHMLTKEAFNALLKTLEEPPEHVIFIFATTEIHKVPATILSRCQRFDFRRIPLKTIMEHLQKICNGDKIDIQEEALLQIAKKADGSMRDAQSVLDQIISYSGNKVTFEDVAKALGVIHQEIYFTISQHVNEQNIKELVLMAKEVFDSGYDLNEFLLGLEEHFRNILVLRSTGSIEFLDVSENYIEQYKETAESFSENDLIAYLQIIAETQRLVKVSQQPNLKFELGLIKLAKMPSSTQIEEILEHLELLKKKDHNAVVKEDKAVSYPSATTNDPTLSQNNLSAAWPKIVRQIGAQKSSILTFLEKAEIHLLPDGPIQIDLGTINAFQKDLLEKSKGIIQNEIEQEFDSSIRLKLKYEVMEAEQIKKEQARETQQSKAEILQKIRSEGGELISKLIDDFDLELN